MFNLVHAHVSVVQVVTVPQAATCEQTSGRIRISEIAHGWNPRSADMKLQSSSSLLRPTDSDIGDSQAGSMAIARGKRTGERRSGHQPAAVLSKEQCWTISFDLAVHFMAN